MPKKMTKEEFIERARAVHGDKYDYSKVDYVNNGTKVCIICPEHGEFWQTPSDHLRRSGCPKCYGTPKKTVEQFIEKARKVHGNKYDYSKVDYVNSKTKVCIVCPEHGEFWQTPNAHLSQEQGCPICSSNHKMNTEEFIEKAKKVHGDKYDYSKVSYVGSEIKVCIICPKHGEFWQKPHAHLMGYGCNDCAIEYNHSLSKRTIDEFIEEARKVHGDKYDYSKVKYEGCESEVCIICPEHGEFMQRAEDHLKGHGCRKCAGMYSLTKQEFIEEAHKVHGDKYDYSQMNYVNMSTPVTIICKQCGYRFNQSPSGHLKGHGCRKCYDKTMGMKKRKTTEQFIEEARKVHGDKYDYSKVNYTNANEKVCIICPEHGEFWQKPSKHLNGQGCSFCGGHIKSNTADFIEKARKVHGDKYDYSRVNYVSALTKVCIICPKHGEFWQTPASHINSRQGCPTCNQGFTKSYILSLITKYDLQSMTSHQLIELIKAGELPDKLKELVFSRPGTKKRLDTIQKLKDELSSDLSDEQIDKKIENDIAEEEKEYEEEQELADGTGDGNQVLDVEKSEDVIKSLKIYDNCKFTISNCESEKFIVEEELHRLWNKALDEETVFIPVFRNEPSSGKFFDKMREMFFEQYDEVKAMTVGSDCVFPYEPNLMQKLMVYYVKNNRCFGNWSAPGAGKSFSRDWAARAIDARVSVYVVPNNVMDTTVKSIREAYGDVNIVVPQKPSDIPVFDRAKHNVVILNYHKFQLQDTCDWINGLLKNKIDFICLDEIHNAKVSDTENISLRNQNMNAFLKMARDANPEMKLLAMSGTPIINNLIEVRELMQLMTGLSYEEEIGSRVSMDNVHNAYKALIINGFRYIPKYGINVSERPVEIDGTPMKDELIDNCGGEVLDMERILSVRKIEHCISEGLVQKSTLVYTHYTDHGRMASGIRNALEKAGFTVGCYTGDEDMETRRKALADFISGRIDVLVGSDPIGEGVDGLQKVCNRIIPVSLPWTASGWQQLIGRVYRQGSAFKEVDVIIPEVVLGKWSWDRRRRSIIENKRTLGEAVTNGSFEHANGYNGQKMQKKLLDMALAALRDGIQDRGVARKEIATIAMPAAAAPRRMSESEVNEVHRAANTSRTENIRANCYGGSQEKFMEYHRARRESIQRSWAADPLDRVAGIIAQYKTRAYGSVIDLGCGENLLKSKVADGKAVVGVDVEKADESVVQANCSDLRGVIGDESFQIAVHCLSLWGNSFDDYIREDYRILESGMNAVLIIVEPSDKFGDGRHFGTIDDFVSKVEGFGFRKSGGVETENGFCFFRFTKN